MKKMSRREFIKSAALAGGFVGLTPLASALAAATKKRSYKKAVVVGSGFGGSVTALRLSLARIPTALIERGKSWTYRGVNTFPTNASIAQGDGRTTWLGEVDGTTGQYPVSRYTGLMERVQGDSLPAVCAAGLGGGSLVYGGVLLQPQREDFEQVFPRIDYAQMDQVFYPRVRSFVSGGSVPDDILNHPLYASMREVIAGATAAGFGITRSDVGFDWNVIRKELNGDIAPAASIGEYAFGCNSNAKNTLDKNYIAEALKTGFVEVHTQHNVTTIIENFWGGYKVLCDVIDENGHLLHRHEIHCQYVFMAAGALNTTKLLLKAKAQGDLKGVNDQVGKSFGGNGDELVARLIYDPSQSKIQGGPPAIAIHDTQNSIKRVSFMHSPITVASGLPDGIRYQLCMSMSVPDKLGTIRYDSKTDKPVISFPFDENASDREAHMRSLAKLPHVPNGLLPGSAVGPANGIWHPLGGAVMGEACSDLGELYGQRNLFVMDGSLMPGSTAAANPSLTIAANAERIMAQLIDRIR